MILSYSFQNPDSKNISTPFAEKFGAEENFVFTPPMVFEKFDSKLEKFFDLIEALKPELIVGFGEFSGRFSKDIKIETVCRNKFRNSVLGEKESFDLYAGDELIKLINSKFSNINYSLSHGMGNSWCNLSAYRICSYLESKAVSTKFSFVHVKK